MLGLKIFCKAVNGFLARARKAEHAHKPGRDRAPGGQANRTNPGYRATTASDVGRIIPSTHRLFDQHPVEGFL
jgi:hypothetical protein